MFVQPKNNKTFRFKISCLETFDPQDRHDVDFQYDYDNDCDKYDNDNGH